MNTNDENDDSKFIPAVKNDTENHGEGREGSEGIQTVVDLYKSAGYDQYEEVFKAEAIDMEVLKSMNDGEIKEVFSITDNDALKAFKSVYENVEIEIEGQTADQQVAANPNLRGNGILQRKLHEIKMFNQKLIFATILWLVIAIGYRLSEDADSESTNTTLLQAATGVGWLCLIGLDLGGIFNCRNTIRIYKIEMYYTFVVDALFLGMSFAVPGPGWEILILLKQSGIFYYNLSVKKKIVSENIFNN